MIERRKVAGWWAFAGLLLTAGLASAWLAARADDGLPNAPAPAAAAGADSHPRIRQLSGDFPKKPSLAPVWTIPVEPLGFAAPGPLYLGQHNAMASLDFIGEDKLLFTFHIPGLLHREPGSTGDTDQRQIRAVVLTVPGGSVQSETVWTVHDRARYLWMLNDGDFLLRDRDYIYEGDPSLALKPALHFPGPLLMLQLDPTQQLLAADSQEPPPGAAKAGPQAPGADANGDDAAAQDIVVRILHWTSGRVMLFSRTHDLVHLPFNSDGYLEASRGNGVKWTMKLDYFGGGNKVLGDVNSACIPAPDFISQTEVLVTACSDMGDDALVAMTTGGDTLWIDLVADRLVWPNLVASANGLRVARETLYVSHSINSLAPLGADDIKGQWVRVLNAATGDLVLDAPADPVLDAGGNVAISPSGRRVAVVNNGAIQIFELPAPPPLPATAPETPKH